MNIESSAKPIRIGIMSIAHIHAQSYIASILESPEFELVGIADNVESRGLDAAKNAKTQFFDSYSQLLASDIDAVVVCSENIKHVELVLMAAEAGKHVLCEKPLSTTLSDGKQMVEACREHKVKLHTAFPCRFSTDVSRAKELIRAHGIGDIIAINATNRGKCPGGWFVDPSLSGGGAIMDHTVHVVDLIRWMLDSEVTQVYAEANNQMYHRECEDTAQLNMKLDSGVFVTLDASWSRPQNYPTWGDVTLDILGTEGTIDLNLFSKNIECYQSNSASYTLDYYGRNFDLEMINSFVHSIRGKSSILATGEDGLAASEVAFAAYESVKSGDVVEIARGL